MSDNSVAWGLHEASRRLRGKRLEKMNQEGYSRGVSDDALSNLVIREPAIHGVRWERRRDRNRANIKGMSTSLGTRWRIFQKRTGEQEPHVRGRDQGSLDGLERLP